MSTNLSGKYAIVGVGQSPLGKVPEMGPIGLFAVAAKNAIEDAGLKKEDVDGLITRGPDDVYCHHQKVGEALGLNVTFSTSTANGGASQTMAVAMACMAIEAGVCNTVVVGYGRDTWSRTHRTAEAKQAVASRPRTYSEFGSEFGQFGAPVNYAIAARRHMERFGTTKAQLGAIAVAFRKHARKNPHAFMQKPLDLDEYLSARLIVDPLCLYDCSVFIDGAGAVVVTTAERARDLRQPPAYVLGFGFGNRLSGWFTDDNMITTGAREAGEAAYRHGRHRPQGRGHRADLRLLHPHGAAPARGLRLLRQGRRRTFRRLRGAGGRTACCPPTPPAASSPKGTSRACSRCWKAPARCAASTPPTGR